MDPIVADDGGPSDRLETDQQTLLTLPLLPLDVLAYVCSFLTTHELAQFMGTSRDMASVVLALGVSKPTRDLPTCPTYGPLAGIYASQYMDADGAACHRAWRAVHPASPALRRLRARRPAPLHSIAMLPLSVPRGAWCLVRPPLLQLGADLIMAYALAGAQRMPRFLPIAAALLSEPLPAGTLVVSGGSTYPVTCYADVFVHMERAEKIKNTPLARRDRYNFEEIPLDARDLRVDADLSGNITIRL
jgi:hypothetical protein